MGPHLAVRGTISRTNIMRSSTCHRYLAVLAAPFLLVGCGASAPAASPSSGNAPGAVEAALKQVKAPPGFRVGACEFLPIGPNTRCYRREPFVVIDTASFGALITASGLKVDRSPPMWCNSGRHPLRQSSRGTIASRTPISTPWNSRFPPLRSRYYAEAP